MPHVAAARDAPDRGWRTRRGQAERRRRSWHRQEGRDAVCRGGPEAGRVAGPGVLGAPGPAALPAGVRCGQLPRRITTYAWNSVVLGGAPATHPPIGAGEGTAVTGMEMVPPP